VHLKDVRKEILDQAKAEKWDFVTCIRRGVFTVPGDGCINFTPIIGTLNERGYNGWAILEGEQDPAEHNPYLYAKKAIAYLDSVTQEAM
jgi:inosose dehydratase